MAKTRAHPFPGVTVIEQHAQRVLQVGDRFEYPPDCGVPGVYEVASVTAASAWVRPAGRVAREVVERATGEVHAFAVPAPGYQVSRRAFVTVLGREE